VAVDVVGAGIVLTAGAGEGVDRRADSNIAETAVLHQPLPARTGQPAGYSTGPQVDVPQRLGGYGPAVGDVGELQMPAGT